MTWWEVGQDDFSTRLHTTVMQCSCNAVGRFRGLDRCPEDQGSRIGESHEHIIVII